MDSVKILSVDYTLLMESLKNKAIIIREKHPAVKRVLLFGSFSKGNYTPESDVDILIVSAGIDVPFLKRANIFIDYFKDIPFDVNLLVYTEDEVMKMYERKDLFIRQILDTATELY